MVIVHVHLVFSDLAVFDTIDGNPRFEKSHGVGITHNSKIQRFAVTLSADEQHEFSYLESNHCRFVASKICCCTSFEIF